MKQLIKYLIAFEIIVIILSVITLPILSFCYDTPVFSYENLMTLISTMIIVALVVLITPLFQKIFDYITK